MKNAVELEGIAAGYAAETVLEDITLCVREAETVAVLGPNGAGKSSLLRVISGALAPRAGEVRLYGRPVSTLSGRERAGIMAVAPQELYTPMPFTVREIAELGRASAVPRWRPPSAADRRAVECALAYTDMLELSGRPFNELSGGEKQRATLAMALAQEPKILLLDEPTSRLDMNHRLEVLQIIERLNSERGITALMTCHDINLAAEFCGRLILLDHGRIVADGSPEAVLREKLLKEVYHCDVRVSKNQELNALQVFPLRRRPAIAHAAAAVHIVAGGGCGVELMRRLSLAGYEITCGVLNAGDTDAQAAAAFGVETAIEKPFSPVGTEALGRAMAMAEKADAVVLCETPFGPGNTANLEILEQALAHGKTVLINDRNLETRDYTGTGVAAAAIRKLLEGGAKAWQNVPDALEILNKLNSAKIGAAASAPRPCNNSPT